MIWTFEFVVSHCDSELVRKEIILIVVVELDRLPESFELDRVVVIC